MRTLRRPFSTTVINVTIYALGAAIVFGWLSIRASSGGLFTTGTGFVAVVPSAPGVEANKSEVLTTSGVTIGTVTALAQGDDGVHVSIKVTGPVRVRRDATTYVVVRNIIGERAIMLNMGTARGLAREGQKLPQGTDRPILEASAVLGPAAQLQELKNNPAVRAFANQQRAVIDKATPDVNAIVAQGEVLAKTISSQQVALSAIGRRSDALLAELSNHQVDINQLLTQTAALSRDTQGLLDDSLTVTEGGLDLATNTVSVVARRSGELRTVLGRLPIVAEHIERVSNDMLKVQHSERGHNITSGLVNLPPLSDLQRVLETGKI